MKSCEDPVFIQTKRAVVPQIQHGVGSGRARERVGGNLDGSATQNPPAPTPRRMQGGDGVPPSLHESEDERQLFGASSVKDLGEKAKSK